MNGPYMIRTQHEPTASCTRFHCYSCGVDEIYGGYITCGECGHVWRTRLSLRWAYIRVMRHMLAAAWHDREWKDALTIAWHIIRVRAKEITFCQLCIHDL